MRGGLYGEPYKETCTLTREALHYYVAPMFADDPMADGKTEARTFSNRLRRKERFKEAGYILFRYARPRIAELNLYVSLVINGRFAGPDGDRPFVIHSVSGIDEQVQEYLFDLGSVGSNNGYVFVELQFDMHIMELGLIMDHADGMLDSLIRIHLVLFSGYRAGEAEQTFDDL